MGERSLSLLGKKRLSNTGAWPKCFSIISPMRCHADSRLEQNGCCACVLRERERERMRGPVMEKRSERKGGIREVKPRCDAGARSGASNISPTSEAERWNKNGQNSSIIRRNGSGTDKEAARQKSPADTREEKGNKKLSSLARPLHHVFFFFFFFLEASVSPLQR